MFYQRSLLSNGIRVITEAMPNVQSVALGIWIHAGSRHESLANQGISHFLEHMSFKGTARHNTAEIARLIDSVGGNLNAFTSRENTCYSAKVLSEHLDLAVDLLCDIVFHSVYDAVEIGREKAVVYEEISMYEDAPEDLVHDLHAQHCWPEHPLGYSTLGSVESITGFDQSTLVDYFNQRYTPGEIVITAAGNVNHQELVAKLEQHLSDYQKPEQPLVETPPLMKGGSYFLQKPLEQAHLCLGTEGINRAHEDHFAFVLLSIILGGGMSSRLFQRIREKEALAYSVFSYLSACKDAGLFVIYAGVGKDNFPKTIAIILEELALCREQEVPAEELQRAKAQFKGSFILGLESPDNHMSRLAKLELYHDRFFSAAEVIAQVEKVTPQQIQALANKYIRTESLNLTVLGDLKKPNNFTLEI